MKEYCRLLGLLAVVLLLLLLYGACGYVVRINSWSLDKVNVPDWMSLHRGETKTRVSRMVTRQGGARVVRQEVSDTVGLRILMFGDSMVELLAPRMSDYAEVNGYELYSVCWYSSTTLGWCQHVDDLHRFMDWARPDYVMISLGGNELTAQNMSQRRRCVRELMRVLEPLPVVWIAPPSWVERPTITRVICGEVGEGRYFDSTRLTFRRAKDGMHPTVRSASEWMDSIAVWMSGSQCEWRIRMTRPQGRGSRRWKQKILKPNAL